MECKACASKNTCRDSAVSWIFLFIGILAALAMRVVPVFMNINIQRAKTAWYIGVGFFFIFFIYRYKISRSRSMAVKKRDLVNKVLNEGSLQDEDRKVIGEILCGLTSSKEQINFITIFVLSGIAIIVALYFDIIK